MRRLLLAATVAAVTIAVWRLAGDGDLGQRLSDVGDRIADQMRGGPPPSWGDVADKVGAFAREERDLKDTVRRLGDQATASPDDPPAE